MLKLTTVVFFALSASAQIEIAVQINNNAGVPSAQLKEAVRIATRLFAATGISPRWEVCSPGCTAEVGMPNYIVGLAGPQLELPAQAALGFSMLKFGKGNKAAVSLPRIEDFAEANNVPAAAVLAYTIAHELCHMISGTKAHSKGVMTAKWDKENALRIGQSRLQFEPRDVEAMRLGLQILAENRREVE